jgi:MFS family permease
MTATTSTRPATGVAAWYAVAVLTLAYMLSMVDRIILSLLVEPIQRDLHINDTQFGLLHGFAFAVFYALAGVPIARIADVAPRRWVVAVGIAVWSAMTALCATARHFTHLLLFRIGVGVGEASLTPASMSMLADLFPKTQLARAIAIYAAGGTMGTALAYILGGFMLKLFPAQSDIAVPILGMIRGWQVIFLVLGLPGMLIAVLALTLKEPARQTIVDRSASSSRALWSFMREERKTMALYFTGFSLLFVLSWGLLSWTPAFLIRRYHEDATTVGYVLGVVKAVVGVVGGVSGGIFTDWLLRRGREDAHVMVGLVTASLLLPAALLLPFVGEFNLAVVLLSVIIFLGTFWGSAATTGLQIITPPYLRAQVSALYIMCANLVGFGIGPLLIGAITDYVFKRPEAVGLSMATVAGVALPVVILFLAIVRKPFVASAQRQGDRVAPPLAAAAEPATAG